MLQRELEILQAFNESECIDDSFLHVRFTGKHDLSHLTSLTERGLLKHANGVVRLAQAGYIVLQEEAEHNAKQAEKEKLYKEQKRKDRRQNFIQDFIMLALSIIINQLIDNRRSVIEFIDQLAEIASMLFH